MHQLGNQLSDTPYYAASPKGHVTVVVEKTKRTPSLVHYNKTVTTATGQQQSQLHDLNQQLLERQEETHPHEQKTLPNSQNCCNRRKYYKRSRLESKKYGEKYNAKDREVS